MLAKEKTNHIEVPTSVLNANQSISVRIQNEVYQHLKNNAQNPAIRHPNEINYEACKLWLNKLYDLFRWESKEKQHFKSKAQLDYYATLMNQWINGIALSSIINQSIDYYHNNTRDIKTGFKPDEREPFDRQNQKTCQ